MTVEQAPPPPGLVYILGWWREVSTAPLMSAVVLTARPRAQTGVAHIADDAGNVMYGVGVSAATDPEGRALLTLVWVEGAVYDVEFGGVKGTLRCDDWDEGSTVPFTGIRGLPGGDGIADPLTWDTVIAGLNGRIASQVPPVVATAVPAYLSAHPDIIEDAAATAGADAGAAAAATAVTEARTGLRVDATGVAATDAANLAAKMASAVTLNFPLLLAGAFVLTSSVNVPSGAQVFAEGATITVGADNVAPFVVPAASSGVSLRGLTVIGRPGDWRNASSVFACTAIIVRGTDVTVDSCRLLGNAGAGVWIDAGADRVRVVDCTIVGPGRDDATGRLNNPATHNYSSGVRVLATGRVTIRGNDISGYAQGVNTVDGVTNFALIDNYIHDIPTQHGFYVAACDAAVIRGNIIRNCGLLGGKIQIGTTGAIDPADYSITGNIVTDVGSHGILLTNPLAGPPRHRRAVVSNNILTRCGGTAESGDGICANNLGEGVLITGNVITSPSRHGVSLDASTGVRVALNWIHKAGRNGVEITDTSDVVVTDNRIKDPGQEDNATAEYGIRVATASTDVTLRGNKITDATGKARYGIYIHSSADQPNVDLIDNLVTGVTDYGLRSNAVAIRRIRGNVFAGTLGAILTAPTNFAANADTSGATLTALETEVNELKALLRANGVLP